MKILTRDDIYTILNDRIKDDQYTNLKDLPQPNYFKDIEKASQKIAEVIRDKKTINIVGDYDVDGVVSTAIMVEFLNELNVKVNYIIPNRFKHGYGLSPKLLDNIEDGLIITVDNGISAYEAGEICANRGLDLIITDHHTVGDKLPKAFAIINPKQKDCDFPFENICGAQVAWYLCAMIKKELKVDFNLMKLFDILTLAIIADIMPMKSLNATMVKKGLKTLDISNRPAIVVLRERFGFKNINEEDIGFKIAPLINCAGRMENADVALKFLLTSNTIDASKQLDYLIKLNETRKLEQLNIYTEAKLQVTNDDDKVIVVSNENWNEGIIGIVASKLSERYKKPAFVFSITNGIAKGSSRSSDVHLYNLVSKCSDMLLQYGGHQGAAGMSLKASNLELFKNCLNNQINSINTISLTSNQLGSTIGELDISLIDANLYDMINSFRPFGLENKMPNFIFNNLRVLDVKKMGKNKEFSKLIVSNENTSIEVIIFIDCRPIILGEHINILATIGKNEFRGDITFNLMLKEILF